MSTYSWTKWCAEQNYRHILDITRALLVSTYTPHYLWTKFFFIVVLLINITLSYLLDNTSPYSCLFNSQFDYLSLHTFNYVCFALLLFCFRSLTHTHVYNTIPIFGSSPFWDSILDVTSFSMDVTPPKVPSWMFHLFRLILFFLVAILNKIANLMLGIDLAWGLVIHLSLFLFLMLYILYRNLSHILRLIQNGNKQWMKNYELLIIPTPGILFLCLLVPNR